MEFKNYNVIDLCLDGEVWKDISGYEKIYQASNYGRIRTHQEKTSFTKKHGIRKWKQRIIRPKGKSMKTGYRVSLWKNGKEKDYLVARLVGTTFLENLINTKMTINHKDGDRSNNNINNLEWLSLGDNIRHGFENGLYKYQKKTRIIDKETNKKYEFRNMILASQYIGMCKSYISYKIKKGQFENTKYRWELI